MIREIASADPALNEAAWEDLSGVERFLAGDPSERTSMQIETGHELVSPAFGAIEETFVGDDSGSLWMRRYGRAGRHSGSKEHWPLRSGDAAPGKQDYTEVPKYTLRGIVNRSTASNDGKGRVTCYRDVMYVNAVFNIG